jgi:hypothetical protein
VSTRHISLGIGLAILLASSAAFAQSVADAGVPTSEPYSMGTIRLTPPMPDGGIYGAPTTTTTTTPSAATTTAPATTPPAAAPTSTAPTTAPGTTAPALPPPPPRTATTAAPPLASPVPPSAALQLEEPELRPRRSSLTRARLSLLNTTLPPLAERSRSQRVLDGVVSLVAGAGMGALAFVVPSTPSNDLRPWFWTMGGMQVASGLINLAWVPARETQSERFAAMPMRTAAERRARVEFGERALEDIAADGARRRVLGALGNAGSSLAMLALIYRDPLFNGTPYSFGAYDAIVLGFTGLQVATGLLSLFSRSDDERLRDDYWQQVGILRAERGVQ